MKSILSKSSLIAAAFSMLFVNTAPSFAATKGAAKKNQPNIRKIERCIKAVNRRAKKAKVPAIIHEAAVRTCWVTEKNKVSLGVLKTLSLTDFNAAAKKLDQIHIEQGFNGKSRLEEPGLLGLDGAKDVLVNVLIQDAAALWFLSAAVGGPPVPSDKDNQTTAKIEGSSAQFTISSGGDTNKNFVQRYVDAHIAALEENPDTAISLKYRMYRILKTASLKSLSKRTAVEKRFVASFESYLRDQYVHMANAALTKYDEWEKKQDKKQQGVAGGASITGIQAAPPDFYAEMGAALMVSSLGAGLATMIAGASSFAASSAAAVSAAALAAASSGTTLAAASAASASAIAAATAASAASVAAGGAAASAASISSAGLAASAAVVTAASSEAATAASAAASLSSGVGSGSAALVLGPVLVVVGFILAGVLGMKQNIKAEKIKEKMNELKAWTKTGKLSARTLLSTREGTIQFDHFYAKATSSSSPGGFVNPADGCRACFYADANFKGAMVCTSGRFDSLAAANDNGEVKKMNNKISSVALDQSTCENSYAVMYDTSKFRGNRHIIRSDIADLSSFIRSGKKTWNNAASSAAFSNKNAPKCEVCTYTKENFEGAKFCTSGAVNKLSGVGMRGKITSLLMNTKDCPAAKVWLYEKNEFVRRANGSGVNEYSTSARNLGKGIRNTALSLYFSADGNNPYEKPASGGCRACMYDRPDHKGEYMCVNNNIPDMGTYRIGGEAYNFKNKASSVQFIYDECKKNEALELEVFRSANYKGTVNRFFGEDVKDLKAIANNVASSVKLSHYDPTKTCQVCTYSEKNYQGEKRCVTGNVSAFDNNLNNKISSIKMYKGGCSGGGALIYGNKSYGGKVQEIVSSTPDLSGFKRGAGNWNNAVSSLKFNANAAALKQQLQDKVVAALPGVKTVDPATLCQICLYKDKNYAGEKQCITGNASSFSGSLNNSVSSVKVYRGACKNGGAIAYRDKRYGGKSAFILNSDPDLTSISGSKLNWNNNISSLKFSKGQRTAAYTTIKKFFPGVSEATAKKQFEAIYGQ